MKEYVAVEPGQEAENKQVYQHQRLLQVFAHSKEPMTVHEVAAEMAISVPTSIKLVNEMVGAGALKLEGKRETVNGRKPNLYIINKNKLFSVSVEILLKRISVAIIDMDFNLIYHEQNKDFILENTQDCLDEVIGFISENINASGIKAESILGIGMGITGRMNKATGESYTYFTFLGSSLKAHLTQMLDVPVFIDNDTRCYGLIENTLGRAKSTQNAIIINLSRGFGSSLTVNNTLVTGGMGFAGEIGHMQFGESDKMCICGKTGCIGNEIGGFALEEEFKLALENGEKSLLNTNKNVRYDDILDIALKGDALSIRLLQEMGHKLGKALGNLINLLNPEIIIIGGKFARAEVIIGNSIRSGMMSTALVNSLRFCELVFSELGETSGIKGAGGLVYEYYGLI